MSESKGGLGAIVTYAAVLARAAAYGIRAANTRRAVERLKARFDERGASAKYMADAMTVLDVDAPTTTAYTEVYTLTEAMSANVSSIVSAADTLSAVAQGLADETTAQHGRMADANRTHHVPMAARQFIKPEQ